MFLSKFERTSAEDETVPLCNTIVYEIYTDSDATTAFTGSSFIPASETLTTWNYDESNPVTTSASVTKNWYVKG